MYLVNKHRHKAKDFLEKAILTLKESLIDLNYGFVYYFNNQLLNT